METSIAAITIAGLLGLLFLVMWVLLLRYKKQELRHKERLTALEKGVPLPPEPARTSAPWTNRVYLLRGMMWLFPGLALFLFLVAAVNQSKPVDIGDKIWRELSLKRDGATEEQLKRFEQEYRPRDDGPAPALCFLGLIPMGVGLAYILFYYSERKAQSGSDIK